ncbi:NB-ARC domain-containing protein [Erwinia pyri]|uniref:NB-ARC domain-containing protein n=1 Tax=Erwinia pyri TaxID=3062598 RepID=A0AA50HNN5_9GAMM|nr:NB-ARC domain-containing protein [Erwinia sp. DE2]WLS79492.1 NB-ARC domain-containing protein [Erwinia sp. DE2]
MQVFIDQIMRKVETSKSESDFTFFFNLLVAGEALTKLIALTVTASLKNDKDRHQYRILHGLVRANGIGEWSRSIEDLLTGTASQYLPDAMRTHQTEFTKKCPEAEWQYQSVQDLYLAMKCFNLLPDSIPVKRDLKMWFKGFTELRNATRGHGATMSKAASAAAPHLEKSIRRIIDNLSLLKLPSAYLKRNMSGKFRVTPLNIINEHLEEVKKTDIYSYEEGVYVYLDKLILIPLLKSDPDLKDFYIANGGFTHSHYEMLSYVTDDKIHEESKNYTAPKGQLPPSESEGLGVLMTYGNCFSNVPGLSYDYINRGELENELYELLIDDRHIAITLLGRGGIGKTSLALKVIPRLYDTERFDAIVWFSSRDIDLSSNGAKLVRADVMSNKDIAHYYSRLFKSDEEVKKKDFDPISYFQGQLTKADAGATLFIFDNFETVDNPIETYKWVDTFVRNPNKILVTTRLRDFKGDYPLQVQGMSYVESMELIKRTSGNLKVEKLSQDNKDKIYRLSAGHPYIMKVLIGDFARKDTKGNMERLIAGSDEILTALFERTYSVLTPCAQRTFLTLSSWNSAVPRLGLESILMFSLEDALEVEKAVDTLIQYSMIEELKASDGHYFLQLPYVAYSFGNKKLKISSLQHIINTDVILMRKFGVSSIDDKKISLRDNFTRYLSSVHHNEDFHKVHKIILERICYTFNDGWRLLANWAMEPDVLKFNVFAEECIQRYLENEKSEKNKHNAWYVYASIAERLSKPYEQILGLTQASSYESILIDDLSNITNKINHLFKTHEFSLGESIKEELLIKLFTLIYKRRNEADAIACSRFAWLGLHLNKEREAKSLIEIGLRNEPGNIFCQRLKRKFERE